MNYRKQQKGFRTSFLRDAHLSYFSRMNIMKIIKSAGLTIVEKDIGGELFFLLKNGNLEFEWINEYERNKIQYMSFINQAKFLDLKNILINEIKFPLKWIQKIIKP